MKTLLVAATSFEIKNILEHYDLAQANYIETPQFDLLITGVGMTATAFALGRALSHVKYNQVLNLGIAGSFNPSYPPGTVLQVSTDTFAELGAEDQEQFLPIETLGFGESSYTAIQPQQPIRPALPSARGITVNKVHGHQPSIDLIKARLAPDVESMEGAAVIYCCNQLNIPCIQVRAISNFVEPRTRNNWKIDLAIENLNNWAIRFLTNA
jgi:futalosine hydrolase